MRVRRAHATPTRTVAALVAGAAALALAVTGSGSAAHAAAVSPSAPRAAAAQATADALPTVTPTPQSIRARGSDVVIGGLAYLVAPDGTDRSAVDVVTAALTAQHVQVRRVATGADVPRGAVGVWLGDDSATAAAAKQLTGADATGLVAEGYQAGTGRLNGRTAVVLDGKDASGTYYAAQTFRQLISRLPGGAKVPGVVVRDWPTIPTRGVIEGFYGAPWSDAQRADQLDFYGEHKMNTYVYSPKDDPYLRDKWRDSYPADQLAAIKALVDRADRNHVTFTYALSPGLSVCYSSPADEKALVDKFQSLWDIGVRSFAVPLDDISYTKWNCDADAAKFGTGGAAAGDAQAYLLNQVQTDFVATHAGSARLEMVPTEYYDVKSSPYKTELSAKLDKAIITEWTGTAVVPATITRADAAAAKQVFGHDVLLWDNYPVNDYVTGQLLLGPYVGRQAGLGESLIGITANPMIEPDASKIALYNVADYTWNDTHYDAATSWQHSLTEFAAQADPGDRGTVRKALAAFADLEYTSKLDPTSAPVLAKKTSAFWSAWKAGGSRGDAAEQRLDAYLAVITAAQQTLTQSLNDSEFAGEAKPWLDSTTHWGKAAQAALQVLVDERAGDTAAAKADRATAVREQAKAKSYVYTGFDGKSVPVQVGTGVLDAFVTQALAYTGS